MKKGIVLCGVDHLRPFCKDKKKKQLVLAL